MYPNGTATSPHSPDPLAVAARGLAIFPIPRGQKIPKLTDWPNRCVSDTEVITRCWRAGCNIGVGCKANGLLVVDLDRHHEDADGVDSFIQLCDRLGQARPETFTVSTPRRGLHLYFWAPRIGLYGNTAGQLGPGIDTRGPGDGENGGGYVVGPGSIVNGRTYDIVNDLPIIELPSWLAEPLDKTAPVVPRVAIPAPRGPRQNRTVGGSSKPVSVEPWVRAAVEGEVQKVLDTPKGTKGKKGEGRNEQLNRSAYTLGGLVGAGILDRDEAEQALTAAAYAVGLDQDENSNPRQIQTTITSGLNAGIRRPRIITKTSTTRGTK